MQKPGKIYSITATPDAKMVSEGEHPTDIKESVQKSFSAKHKLIPLRIYYF